MMYVLKFRFQDDSDEYEEKMDSLKEVSDFLNGFFELEQFMDYVDIRKEK